MTNKIEILVALNEICKAYGATAQFGKATAPVLVTMPASIDPMGEVAYLLQEELINTTGCEIVREGHTLTCTL